MLQVLKGFDPFLFDPFLLDNMHPELLELYHWVHRQIVSSYN